MRVVDNYYKNAAQSPPAEILTQPDITASNQATMSPLPSHVVSSVEFASVFISYGGPDERFAISLNEELIARGVQTFIFAKDALWGEKLHREMRVNINKQDRMILICSRESLSRPGVQNELEEVLQREAREGGRAILLPITVDDYVFTEWTLERADVVLSVRERVIGDFKNIVVGNPEFRSAVDRLVRSLQKRQQTFTTTHLTSTPAFDVPLPDLRISYALQRGKSHWRDVSHDEIRIVLSITNHATLSATAPYIRLQVPPTFSLNPVGIASRQAGAPLQFVAEAIQPPAGAFIALANFVIHPTVPAEFAEVALTVKGNTPVPPCEIRYRTAASNLNGGEGAIYVDAAAIAEVLQRLVEPRER